MGFGDQWATINLLLHRGEALREVQWLSRWQAGEDLRRVHAEILNELNAPPWLCLSDKLGDVELDGFDVQLRVIYHYTTDLRILWDDRPVR